MNIKFDILTLLAGNKMRFRDIRETLYPKYKRVGYSSPRSFDAIISRELRRLRPLLIRNDEGHQRVYYSLNKNGTKELAKMQLKGNINQWVDEMSLPEIRGFLSEMEKETGLRPKFVKNMPAHLVTLKDGKSKPVELTGFVWYRKKTIETSQNKARD